MAITEEQRREWLSRLKPGDRVQLVPNAPKVKPGSGTVVATYRSVLHVFDDFLDEVESYHLPGAIHNGVCCEWRIEPLPSLWRKEPPGEEGWWWVWMNVPAELDYEVEAFRIELISGVFGFCIDGNWHEVNGIDAQWQKATVPEPPAEVKG